MTNLNKQCPKQAVDVCALAVVAAAVDLAASKRGASWLKLTRGQEIDGKLMMKVSAIGAAGYSAQLLGMPKTAKELYWTDKVAYSEPTVRFMGHALAGGALVCAGAASAPTKASLQGAAAWWLTAPLMMGVQCKAGEFKTEMAVANTVTCGAIGVGCLIAANKMK